MSGLRTIRLYGETGARFGREHRLSVASPAEAIKALCVLIPGFEEYLIQSKDRGIGFSVFLGRSNLSQDQLSTHYGEDDIRIAPMPLGSKKGWGKIIGGYVLYLAGMVAHLYGYNGLGTVLTTAGKTLMINGASQLLTPTPKTHNRNDRPDESPGYNFNGAVNTMAQGNPVPLLYGRMITGSAVISAGIVNEDIAPNARVGAGVGYNGGNWVNKEFNEVLR